MNRTARIAATVALVASLSAAQPAMAKDHGNGHGKDHQPAWSTVVDRADDLKAMTWNKFVDWFKGAFADNHGHKPLDSKAHDKKGNGPKQWCYNKPGNDLDTKPKHAKGKAFGAFNRVADCGATNGIEKELPTPQKTS